MEDTLKPNSSTTRRRAINSPSADDRQSLLTEADGVSEDDGKDGEGKEEETLTLLEQVVLMGMKDRQVFNTIRVFIYVCVIEKQYRVT